MKFGKRGIENADRNLRKGPGEAGFSPASGAALADSADAVPGAATAAASRLVVVRKSLRLRDWGADF